MEVLYGHIAEVMLSQPATKIFLKTSEPNAAEWISRAIGEVEIRGSGRHGRADSSRAGATRKASNGTSATRRS